MLGRFRVALCVYIRRSCGYRLAGGGMKVGVALYSISALATIVYGTLCTGVEVMGAANDFLMVMTNGSL